MQPQSLFLLMLALRALCTSEAVDPPPTCGMPGVAPDESVSTGSKEATPHSWPWVVLIRYNDSLRCGGSILNESWAVTAVHCVPEISDAFPFYVEAGRHCRDCDEASVQRRQAVKVVINPQFETNFTENDIALLQVSEAFQFNEKVSPICLPTLPLEDTDTCFAAGWSSYGTQTPSEHLLQAQLPIVPNQVCGDPEHYGNGSISKNMICAVFVKQGVQFCIDDYGGPLMCKAADSGAWQLHGVLSSGDSCDNPMRPPTFTRVQKYSHWIREGGAER